MPLYEYQCTSKKCKHVYEELAKFDEVVKCPQCGKTGEKLIAEVAHPVFVHRRGNFYQRRLQVKSDGIKSKRKKA